MSSRSALVNEQSAFWGEVMTGHLRSLAFLVQFLMQRLAVLGFAGAALTLMVVTVMAAAGQAP